MADDNKKLSYEEAAEQLGLTVDQLRDLRADGRIRDHADYGNWTFKAEDVQALKAELEAEAAEPPPAADPNTKTFIVVVTSEGFTFNRLNA